MIETVYNNNEIVAMIIRSNFESEKDINFITSEKSFLQVASMSHPKGKIIDAHVHKHITRKITATQEIILLKKGSMRIDLFSESKKYLESKNLTCGDIVLLISGGHAFEILEDAFFFEFKQGPYLGTNDKVRFKPNILQYIYRK